MTRYLCLCCTKYMKCYMYLHLISTLLTNISRFYFTSMSILTIQLNLPRMFTVPLFVKLHLALSEHKKYTVNQRLLVSVCLCDVFFMFANTHFRVTSQCANTHLHVMSQHHDVTSTLIAIQFDSLCTNC